MANKKAGDADLHNVDQVQVKTAAEELILSASGWRKIFSTGGSEGRSGELKASDRIVVGAMAMAFGDAAIARRSGKQTVAAVATDSRPTGAAIAEIIIRVLIAKGIAVRFSGVTAVPELLAAVQTDGGITAFAYISASHNPIGYNGVKFGYADGSVAGGEESAALIASFKKIISSTQPEIIAQLILNADPKRLDAVYTREKSWKQSTYTAYSGFAAQVAADSAHPGDGAAILDKLKRASGEHKIGILIDFNGSARTVSVDTSILEKAGCLIERMNDTPGEIAHGIVPEGEFLEPCRRRLEELHKENPVFLLGYVPDNDGDRGNLVYIGDDGKAYTLHAQSVFALSCLSELSYLAYRSSGERAVIVANGPTSLRVDRIATYFGTDVKRAEVGEANVVNLARRLREEGAVVRILGEGSAGGTIIHPATCRDPLNTVFSLLKLLLIRSDAKRPGPFEIWCEKSGQTDCYRENFSLPDVLRTLPAFTTTGAYEKRAVMHIKTEEHGLLKERYERLFAERWPDIQDDLSKIGFYVDSWGIFNYEGTVTRPGAGNRDKDGRQRGGLKVMLYNADLTPTAFLWMRGSGTEPVFRILVDVEGARPEIEELLLNTHRELILKADNEI